MKARAILAAIFLLAGCAHSGAKKNSPGPSIVGDYFVGGAHPWSISVAPDRRFVWTQFDTSGPHIVQGAWLVDESILYFITEAENDTLSVFMRFHVAFDSRGEASLQVLRDRPSFFLKRSLVTGEHRTPSIRDVLAGDVGVVADLKIVAKKRPNQSPEPTAMSVTPPAAQEPRQP